MKRKHKTFSEYHVHPKRFTLNYPYLEHPFDLTLYDETDVDRFRGLDGFIQNNFKKRIEE